MSDTDRAHYHAERGGYLPQWTVYGPGTSDRPGVHVARMFVCRPEVLPTDQVLEAATLDELRDLLPPGLSRIERFPEDDPNILEVWL